MKTWAVHRILPHLLVVGALAGIVVQGSRSIEERDLPLRELSVVPCRLDQRSCSVQPEPGVSILLTVAPRPVPAGTPFIARLVLEGVDARQAELEFEGVDMNMGLFRQMLEARAGGLFESSVTLPLCATGAMRWRARLLLRTDAGLWIVPFDLTTGS